MRRDIRYQALRPSDWTKADTTDRRSSPFRSTWSQTERDLLEEIRHLGAFELVISVDVDEDELRRDGAGLLANAKVRSPRVIVWVDGDAGPMSFQVDKFAQYRDNVRAVALGLNSLRRLDRYGMADTGQQYTGWLALPSAGESTDVAATVIAEAARIPLERVLEDPKAAVRQAQIRTHPDRGGDPDAFQRVTEAAEALT